MKTKKSMRFDIRCRCPKCDHVFFTNENKRKIIGILKSKDMIVTDLCKEAKISRTAVYHHLDSLRKEGLIKDYYTKGQGQPHYISLKKKKQ